VTEPVTIGDATLYAGDACAVLAVLPAASVHCCITSPPYWGLRDYGTAKWEGGDPKCDHRVGRFETPCSDKQKSNSGSAGHQARGECPKCGAVRVDEQLGLEQTPEEYVARLVLIFREVRRVLRDDGTLWLNLGDSYTGGKQGRGDVGNKICGVCTRTVEPGTMKQRPVPVGMKPKDLVGIPWRVAFALQADGWWLRQDIIWAKPNPMPESVTDRCTKAHEFIFLLTKSARYYYDAEAAKEPNSPTGMPYGDSKSERAIVTRAAQGETLGKSSGLRPMTFEERKIYATQGRNLRSVWTIPTKPFKDAHFATFPPELPERCIRAGTSERGCCPKCGRPWERIVEKSRRFESGSGKSGNAPVGKNGPDMQGGGETGDVRRGPCVDVITLGWRPCCKCAKSTENLSKSEPVPCTVLDPFSGAGTTAMVAALLGRRAIGIDLSAEYNRMAAKRIGKALNPSTFVDKEAEADLPLLPRSER